MQMTKLRRSLADLVRVNVRYLTDAKQRSTLRSVLRKDGFTPQQQKYVHAEVAAAPAAAQPFRGLASTSLTIATVQTSGQASPHLNLLIGEVREGGVFAGVHTALTAATRLAARLDLPLRVVMLDFISVDNTREKAAGYIRATFGVTDVTVVPRENLRETVFGTEDVWLATHWKTAHAAQVACEVGTISPHQVAYLIQDYEPGFSPWSTDSVLASATYHAGFTPIVNSVPLWSYLCARENLVINRAQVFAPSFDDDRLRRVAADRTRSDVVTVLFYGRPSKHRNLFRLGVSAIASAVHRLGSEASTVSFRSIGEPHDEISLGAGQTLTSLGRLNWDDYFSALATTDVLLSLQQSPHPSHPPFDAAISGALAVTNEFDGTRAGLHPRILPVPANTAALAEALSTTIRRTREDPPAGYLPVEHGLLGGSLEVAIEAVAPLLGAKV